MSNLKRIKTYMGTAQKTVPQMEEDGAQMQKQQVSFQDKINNIIETMESKYTSNLTDRHVDETQKLIKEMEENNFSFYYLELESLSHLISLQFKRVLNGKKEFLDVLLSLVQICNRPFLKQKTSDELNYVPKTVYLLNSFSEILQENLAKEEKMYKLFLSILTFINDFVSTGIDDFKNQESDFKMKKLYGNNFSLLSILKNEGTRNLRLISNSKILETLVYIITKNIYSENCIIIIINIMLNSALYKVNAEKLANLGALKDCVLIISNSTDFRNLLVRCCIEAIWNILENGGQNACKMMAYEEIVNELFYTFNNVIKNCFRLEDRNIRNDICILINYVVSSPESHNYFIYRDTSLGSKGIDMSNNSKTQFEGKDAEMEMMANRKTFLEVLLYYATYDEIKSIQREKDSIIQDGSITDLTNRTKNKSLLDPHEFFFTTSPDDIEFKKVIWTCILYIIKDNYTKKEVVTQLEQYKFINCLLLYLDPEAMRFSCISRWQQPQLKDIQLLCLNILLNIVPLYQDYFEKFKGYSTLIKFLQIYQDHDRKNLCLKTINNIINSELIKKDLTEEKLIDFLLEIINSNDNSLEAREYAFNIISQMCVDNKLAQKEFRRKGGIDILQKNLNYQNILDQIGNQKLFILVVLDCLWNAVIGNKRNEEQFIVDSLSTLFELLEQSDGIHIKIILSCIASLVDNKRSFSYFIQWKSKTNSNIDTTKLLINIYRSEDEKYGVKFENGILDVKNNRPLNPNTSYLIRKRQKIENEEMERKRMRITKQTTQNSFLGITKNIDNGMNKTNQSISSQKTASSGHSANMLQSIYRSEDFVESYLTHKIAEITKSFDLRETIYSIFYRVGFNNISINSNDDKQTFVSIKMYPIYKNLENWLDVMEEYEDTNFRPTTDDSNWILTQIEESKDKMNQAIKQQKVIYDNIIRAQQDELNEYFYKIKRMGELKKENERLKVHEKQERENH